MKPITPKAAQLAYEGRKRWRTAILTRAVSGRFFTWRKGGRVKVQHTGGGRYTIQRARWKGSLVPLANALCNVPRNAFRFTV